MNLEDHVFEETKYSVYCDECVTYLSAISRRQLIDTMVEKKWKIEFNNDLLCPVCIDKKEKEIDCEI